ncbi:helix-turn-helix domain-containing protein [Vibrio rumoiensis]|uniref:Helix-turn-helix domain-containing protein n=1 Tax=Vibrio rumoiensis TaxID=76258 RepID=A0ABW7IVD6_9VIBR
MNSFSSYLVEIRTQKGLTQKKLLDSLIEYDEAFKKLDLNTLSRWERGVTTPPLTKQILIARCLDCDIKPLLPDDTPNEEEKLAYSLLRTVNPYSKSVHEVSLNKIKTLLDFSEVEDLIDKFHKDYLCLDINSHELYLNNVEFLSIIDSEENNLLGHLIYGFISEQESNENIHLSNIKNIKFTPPEDINKKNSILYIVSAYSSRAEPRVLTLEKITSIIQENKNIKGFCITIQYQEVLDFFSTLMKYTIISLGEKVKYGGIKVYNINTRYIQIYIKSEVFLSSTFIYKSINHL